MCAPPAPPLTLPCPAFPLRPRPYRCTSMIVSIVLAAVCLLAFCFLQSFVSVYRARLVRAAAAAGARAGAGPLQGRSRAHRAPA
jgi:hypothetical protein